MLPLKMYFFYKQDVKLFCLPGRSVHTILIIIYDALNFSDLVYLECHL